MGKISKVTFRNRNLQRLMQIPRTDLQESAEQANLCMEERISASRQAAYEAAVGSPGNWEAWRVNHLSYVDNEVHRRDPLSAAFDCGQPSLRSDIGTNQYLYRVEKIDHLLRDYKGEAPVGPAQINEWINARDSNRLPSSPTGPIDNLIRALEDLTKFFNDKRDGRPTFAVFAADFPGLDRSSDWAKQMCNRCGLTHHFTGGNVTLALFRYRVQDVLDGSSLPGRTLFAVPTVLDQRMSNVCFPAPTSSYGHAVGLAPKQDCSHLTGELIHARMDYQAHHWMKVDTVKEPRPSPNQISSLREAHLSCIRRHSADPNYGMGCV